MEKLIVVIMLPVMLMVASWLMFRDYRNLNYVEGQDCRKYCEWQVSQMSETFNALKIQMNDTCKTLIAAYEEKLHKLHGSDMDMALIREQMQKEFVALFQYEVQSFQGYFATRVAESTTYPSSQFCTGYCSSLEMQLQECKDNVTFLWSKSLHISQRLTYRERHLLYHLQSSFQQRQKCLVSASLSRSIAVIALFLMIVSSVLMVGLTLHYHHRVYVCNVVLEKLNLQAERRTNLTKKFAKNTDRFWQERFSKLKEDESEMKIEFDKSRSIIRSLEAQVSSLKMHELKQKRQLTSEIFTSHKRIVELETLLKRKSDDRTAKKQLMLAKTVKAQDETIRELKQQIKRLDLNITMEREIGEADCLLEKERTFREIQRNSRLEQQNIALREQASRLEEGLLEKVSKTSKRGRLLPRILLKDQASQTTDSSENAIDERLTDIRQEFESRFNNLLKRIEDDRAKETEKVMLLKMEHEELRMKLEVANERCTFLEGLVYKAPTQSQVLMCNVDGLKFSKGVKGRSRGELRSVNLIAGVQKVEAHFLTPPFVNEFVPDNSPENYLSIQ